MDVNTNTLLSELLIDMCFGQDPPTEQKLVDLCTASIQSGVIRLLEEDSNSDDPCALIVPGNADRPMHIGAVFIILVASILGVAFPLVAKYNKNLNVHPYWIVLGKCAGTGVILACALIHMIQPANAALTSECLSAVFNEKYEAFAYLFALVAILSVHLLEFFLLAYLARPHDAGHVTSKELASGGDIKQLDGGKQLDSDEEGQQELKSCQQPASVTSLSNDEAPNAQALSEAYMVEFVVTAHSIFIGLAVGVTDKDTLKALLVALIFHQFFEGIALGSRLADVNLGLATEFLLAAIFVTSAPVGIAIGIGVIESLNTNSQGFLLAQGVFDGISGGILLYTGFIFLLKDFATDMESYCVGKHQRLMRFGMFAALWVLAGLMAMIGKYL